MQLKKITIDDQLLRRFLKSGLLRSSQHEYRAAMLQLRFSKRQQWNSKPYKFKYPNGIQEAIVQLVKICIGY